MLSHRSLIFYNYSYFLKQQNGDPIAQRPSHSDEESSLPELYGG